MFDLDTRRVDRPHKGRAFYKYTPTTSPFEDLRFNFMAPDIQMSGGDFM